LVEFDVVTSQDLAALRLKKGQVSGIWHKGLTIKAI
jgi:hypothetical protein